jgi:hypothetical protein
VRAHPQVEPAGGPRFAPPKTYTPTTSQKVITSKASASKQESGPDILRQIAPLVGLETAPVV